MLFRSFLFESLTILVFAFYLSADAGRVRRQAASWMKPDRQKVFITIWDIAVAFCGTGIGVWYSLRGERFQTWTPAGSIRR